LSSSRPQTSGAVGHKKSSTRQKHNSFMTEDQLIDTLTNLKTSKGVRNGMLKPSVKRHGVESLGMTSFNLTR
jgi:hypothetical protein